MGRPGDDCCGSTEPTLPKRTRRGRPRRVYSVTGGSAGGTLFQFSAILTSTPAGSSSFMSASTVLSVGFTMSMRRLWVRSSN
jgi:hypothetical protein